jgi:hypothetical protein
MSEVRELIDTEVDAVDVRELIDTELDDVCGGGGLFAVGGNGGLAFNIGGTNTNFAQNGGG